MMLPKAHKDLVMVQGVNVVFHVRERKLSTCLHRIDVQMANMPLSWGHSQTHNFNKCGLLCHSGPCIMDNRSGLTVWSE